MKKRRELDALVNGKSGRRKKKGQHELLRNDTDSSDVEEFAIPPKTIVRKRGGLARLCSTCVAVCGFFLLTACVVAVAGLVWVHVELKREVDNLTRELDKVKSDRISSSENLDDLQTWKTNINSEINDLKEQLTQCQTDLSGVNGKIDGLTTTTTGLSKSIAAAPQLSSLPVTVDDLRQQIAQIGSDVGNVKQDMLVTSDLQGLEGRVARLESAEAATPSPNFVTAAQQLPDLEVEQLRQAVTAMNVSMLQKIEYLQSHSDQHMVEVDSLLNTTSAFEQRIALLELHPSTDVMETGPLQTLVEQAVGEAIAGLPQFDESESLSEIRQQVDNITIRVEALRAQSPGTEVSTEQFDMLNNQLTEQTQQVQIQFEKVNSSLTEVQRRVSSLESQVQYIDTRLPTDNSGGDSGTQPEALRSTPAPATQAPSIYEDLSKSSVNPLGSNTGSTASAVDSHPELQPLPTSAPPVGSGSWGPATEMYGTKYESNFNAYDSYESSSYLLSNSGSGDSIGSYDNGAYSSVWDDNVGSYLPPIELPTKEDVFVPIPPSMSPENGAYNPPINDDNGAYSSVWSDNGGSYLPPTEPPTDGGVFIPPSMSPVNDAYNSPINDVVTPVYVAPDMGLELKENDMDEDVRDMLNGSPDELSPTPPA